jgi:hypothetical protein
MIVACMLLSSCATQKEVVYVPKVETVEVKAPVPTVPPELKNIEIPERPVLDIELLTEEDRANYTKFVQAVANSFLVLTLYAEQLEERLKTIKNIVDEEKTLNREEKKTDKQQ